MSMEDHGFRKTPSVEINGAQVNSAVKPRGGQGGLAFSAMIVSAGTGTLDGLFLWRVETEGWEGIHEWIRSELIPETKWRSGPVFLPSEIVKSARKSARVGLVRTDFSG